jgi:hypothetical protein
MGQFGGARRSGYASFSFGVSFIETTREVFIFQDRKAANCFGTG